MLLPEIGVSGFNLKGGLPLYYIINSEWDELNDNMECSSPKTPGCDYYT